VAGVADGLRRYHESSGAHVDELRMTLPISVRRPGDPSAGNRFVPVRFALALSADPRQLVATVSRTVREWRDGPALAMTDTMASVLSALPAPLVARVFGSLLRNVDFVATNVPGPSVPVSIAGARMDGLYAFAPPSGAALNVSLVTNAQRCCIGVNMDPEAIGDPDLMTASLRKGLHKVVALGRQGERAKPVRAGAGR
jgi:diacylglycerol O-acyltransferase / wax synthase